MTDFEKYLVNHQQKQKNSKFKYYISILGFVCCLTIFINSH